MDLSSFILVFGNIRGVPGVLDLADNARFAFEPPEDSNDWKGTKNPYASGLHAPFLALKSGENMFAPEGWTFGCDDDDRCDIQIARDYESGVSRTHFRIDIGPATHHPRLRNLSRNIIRIRDCAEKRPVILANGQSFEIRSTAAINLGKIRMLAWRPKLSDQEERQYRLNAEDFSKQFLDARPRPNSTIMSSKALTFSIRFGINGAVYARDVSGLSETGSYASIYKVIEMHSKKVYAAKMPHFKGSDTPSASRKRWESLTEEFRTMACLRHPNIVQAIEVLEGADGTDPPWLIMEWMPMNLRSITLPSDDVPSILQDIARGLLCMHEKDRTHRDLNPGNVLIQRNKDSSLLAKLADFGTTKYDILDEMHTVTGTSIYMAPELWDTKLPYTKAVDMWSFGVLALDLLTKWNPPGWTSMFAPEKREHRRWIKNTLLPRIDVAPEHFAPLLRGLLCIDTEHRWTAAKSVSCLEEITAASEATETD